MCYLITAYYVLVAWHIYCLKIFIIETEILNDSAQGHWTKQTEQKSFRYFSSNGKSNFNGKVLSLQLRNWESDSAWRAGGEENTEDKEGCGGGWIERKEERKQGQRREGGRKGNCETKSIGWGAWKISPKIHEKCKTSANTGQIWVTQKSPKRHVTKSTIEKYCRLYSIFLWWN